MTTTDLYFEVRGQGPAVLFIAGATGDAGHFARAAERLADEFTVITYDRRGNSRSRSNAAGAGVATIAAQAYDAATLIEACDLDEAVVFGTSGGAIITLELVARHPQLVRGAVIHEPPLLAVIPHDDGPDPLADIVALARTDAAAALEAFVRLNSSDTAWASIEATTRERMRANADTLFHRELEQFTTYRPDVTALTSNGVPMELLHSAAGVPFIPAVNAWLQANLGLTSRTIGGHHAPYLDTPALFADEIRPTLKELAETSRHV